MTRKTAEQILTQISIDGSEMNQAYIKWISSKIAQNVFSALAVLNTSDRVASELKQTPGYGENSAATTLGYITGRSLTLNEIQELHLIKRLPGEEPEETFSSNQE